MNNKEGKQKMEVKRLIPIALAGVIRPHLELKYPVKRIRLIFATAGRNPINRSIFLCPLVLKVLLLLVDK